MNFCYSTVCTVKAKGRTTKVSGRSEIHLNRELPVVSPVST